MFTLRCSCNRTEQFLESSLRRPLMLATLYADLQIALKHMRQRYLESSACDANLSSTTRKRTLTEKRSVHAVCCGMVNLALATADELRWKRMSTFYIVCVSITTTFSPVCNSGRTTSRRFSLSESACFARSQVGVTASSILARKGFVAVILFSGASN